MLALDSLGPDDLWALEVVDANCRSVTLDYEFVGGDSQGRLLQVTACFSVH
jgi:hypothetical protein